MSVEEENLEAPLEFNMYEEEALAVETPPAEETPVEEVPAEVPAEEETPVETPAEVPAETPAPTGFSKEELAEAVAAGVKASQPVEKKKEEDEVPPLTQEEIDGMLKTAKYSVEDLQGIGLISADADPEEAARVTSLFEEMQLRAVQNATAVAQLQAQQLVQQMQQQFEPMQQAYAQQQAKQVEDAFFSTYPVLKAHEKIVTLAAQQAKQEGRLEGKTFQESSELVAADAAKLIKEYASLDIDLKATPESAPAPATPSTPARSVPKPAGTAGTGRSQEPKPTGTGAPDQFSIYND